MPPVRSPLPASLWAATAPAAPETPPLVGEVRADVAVVGAGFCGLSTALHAAESGARVVVLEAAEAGFGASGRNGGQVIPGLKLTPGELAARFGAERGARYAAFADTTADFTFDLIARHAIDCAAARTGWIQGVHTSRVLPEIEAKIAALGASGAPVRLVGRDEMAHLTGAEEYVAGYLDPRGGGLNPLAYARGLARAALRAGATIHGASPVVAIRPEAGRWRLEAPGGSVLAEQVVLATNAYTDRLWPGLERTLIPVFSYQVATRPLGHNLRGAILPEGHMVSDTRRVLSYFRLDPEGRLVLGGRGGYRDTSEARFFGHVQRALERIYPAAKGEPIEFRWAGKVALTLDHLPHLADLAPGVTAALGFNGRGVAMASAFGRVVAKKLAGTPPEELEMPVRPVRPILFHGLRRPVIAALVRWKRLRDNAEAGH